MVYRANRSGIYDLLNSPETEAVLLAVMEEKKAVAIAIAPVETGRYRNAFVVFLGRKKDRPMAVLKNLMWYAIAPEFGTEKVPRHRTLGKALGVADR